jgi:hypothetical protein
MPTAWVTCNFILAIGSKNLRLRLIFRLYSSLLAEKFIFNGKPKPAHSLVACEFLVFNSNKNLRYAWLLAVGCACELITFLMATRTCAIAWFAAIPIANTI